MNISLARWVVIVGSLALAAPAFAAQHHKAAAAVSYDCQARMDHVRGVPAPMPGERDPWQCLKPKPHQFSTALDWFRDSLEYCRIATSAYHDAMRAAARAAARYGRGHWLVFMDADETVLDNSLYDKERQRCGEGFSNASWAAWLKAGLARDVPGAAAFTHAVHRQGGLVAIVSNRSAVGDPVTRRNLTAAGIWFDDEIGHAKGRPHAKTARWRRMVARLEKRTGKMLTPVIWVGDQVTDFPILDSGGHIVRAMGQSDPGVGIGTRFFLIPNPIYGDWTANAQN
ncbi:MAG: HAD family acid phosphatase [Stellaceae bacterium]